MYRKIKREIFITVFEFYCRIKQFFYLLYKLNFYMEMWLVKSRKINVNKFYDCVAKTHNELIFNELAEMFEI